MAGSGESSSSSSSSVSRVNALFICFSGDCLAEMESILHMMHFGYASFLFRRSKKQTPLESGV
jgi:hypothetical protein